MFIFLQRKKKKKILYIFLHPALFANRKTLPSRSLLLLSEALFSSFSVCDGVKCALWLIPFQELTCVCHAVGSPGSVLCGSVAHERHLGEKSEPRVRGKWGSLQHGSVEP